MIIIRLAKIAVVAALAAYALLVGYNNIVDYGSNYEFVRHVLSMDTTFPGNALMGRAITDETVWRSAYALIIATEGLTGFCSHSVRWRCSDA
jgi:predicted small integral membrane protein